MTDLLRGLNNLYSVDLSDLCRQGLNLNVLDKKRIFQSSIHSRQKGCLEKREGDCELAYLYGSLKLLMSYMFDSVVRGNDWVIGGHGRFNNFRLDVEGHRSVLDHPTLTPTDITNHSITPISAMVKVNLYKRRQF